MFACHNIQRIFKKYECISTQNEDIRKGYLVSNCAHCGKLFIIECDIVNNRFIHKKRYNKTAVSQFTKIKDELIPYKIRATSKEGSYQPSYKYGDGSNIKYLDTDYVVEKRKTELKVFKVENVDNFLLKNAASL